MTPLPTLAVLTVRGIPLPHSVREDDVVTLLALCCLFLGLTVLTRCRSTLAENIRTFFLMHSRTRNTLFNLSTVSDLRLMALLTPLACILVSTFVYFMFLSVRPEQMLLHPPVLWIGLYSACCLLYVVVKRMMYAIVGWVFIDRRKVRAWMQAYTTVLHLTAFTMLPVTLLVVFFDIGFDGMKYVGLSLIVLSKLLILFKWIKLFCDKPYGYIPICVYFCALEIIPLFYMVVGIMKLNEFVVFNF